MSTGEISVGPAEQEKEFASAALELMDVLQPRLEKLLDGMSTLAAVRPPKDPGIIPAAQTVARRVSQRIENGLLPPAEELRLAVRLCEFEAVLSKAST